MVVERYLQLRAFIKVYTRKFQRVSVRGDRFKEVYIGSKWFTEVYREIQINSMIFKWLTEV